MNSASEITTAAELHAALREWPPAFALALAVRQALRTLPLISLWLDWDEEEALPVVLPTLRPLAAAYAMALMQARFEAEAAAPLPGDVDAGLLAADVDAAIRHATAAISRATSVVANRRTQQAFVHARNACAAAVRAAYAASAGSDAQASARALSHMAELFDGWAPIGADLGEGERARSSSTAAEALLARPLWLVARPGWAEQGWEVMRALLLRREKERWRVWTDWYDAILDPGLFPEPPDPARERRRLQLPEAVWQQGPAAANAAIAERLAKKR